MIPDDLSKRYRDSDWLFYEDLLHEKHAAFVHLYRQTYAQCIPYVLKRGSDKEQAEDLLQECLAIFVTKIRDGSYVHQENTRITTYFHRIYLNQWKKSLEQQSRRAEVGLENILVTGTDDDGRAFDAELPEAILQAYDDDERHFIFKRLDRAYHLLAEDCRKVLKWFYVEDRSLREIAAALDITEASATQKRFRCAKYLKEKFHLK